MIELLCTDYNKKATSIHYYFGNAVLVLFLKEHLCFLSFFHAIGKRINFFSFYYTICFSEPLMTKVTSFRSRRGLSPAVKGIQR